MPETPPDLDAFDDPAEYLEAIAAFRARVPMTRAEWDALTAEARERAFTVSGIAQADLLKQVFDSLDRAVQDGTDFDDFREEVAEKLETAWAGSVANPAARQETIFRTNLATAYSAGRHRQMSDPAVKRRRPYIKSFGVGDGRQSEICRKIGTVILPADHAWWRTHTAPLHFQAIADDALVMTKRGDVPIRDVRPGDLALTHQGRWRRVTMALHKWVIDQRARILELASGRRLCVTHDHPVLVTSPVDNGVFWKRAGDLQIGDELLEHGNQVSGAEDVVCRHPENAPALIHEPSIAREVVGLAKRVPVIVSVNLNGNVRVAQCYVEDVAPDGDLRRGAITEESEQVVLRWGEFLPEVFGHGRRGALPASVHMHGVAGGHSLAVASMSLGGSSAQAPRPVIGSAAFGNGLRRECADPDLLASSAHGNPVHLAPLGNQAIRDAHVALQGTDASALLPVLDANQFGERIPIGECNWHASAVKSIVEEVKSGEFCDLSVEEDETYTANGLIVHNCRRDHQALTEDEARREGITSSPPDVDAAPGFGRAPTIAASEIEVDPSEYPPEIADIVAERLGSGSE